MFFLKKGEEATPQFNVLSRTGRKLRRLVQKKRPTIDFVYSAFPTYRQIENAPSMTEMFPPTRDLFLTGNNDCTVHNKSFLH
jgi:hypothetical protein